MATPTNHTVGELMAGLRAGQAGAAERLVEIFYSELKRIALHRMRAESPGHTLQATALVHELYLELRKIRQLRTDASRHAADDRTAFLALAAHLMKRLLIHHSRPLSKQSLKLSLEEGPEPAATARLNEIDQALEVLGKVDPKLRRVVEMKIFEGRSIEEIAAHLACTTRSVDRYWSVARAWLREHFSDAPESSDA